MTPSSSANQRSTRDRGAVSQQIRQLMDRGVTAARAGQHERADAYFQSVIQLDPDHQEAWLWRAGIARDPVQSLACLNHVLAIDPDNEAALAGLKWVEERQEAKTVTPAEPVEEASLPDDEAAYTVVSSLREGLPETAAQPAGVQAEDAPILGWLTILTGVLAVLVVVVIGALFLLSRDFTSPALAEMSSPEPTATEAIVAQAAAPATSTSTATATHTSTPTATHTPTLMPSSTPTETPLPTATPIPLFTPDPAIAPAEGRAGKWINVSLAEQMLIAYEGDQPVYKASVSTGLPQTPTVKGVYHIYRKLASTTMSGSDYYLPNVLYTQYYHKGYAIHGAYWHDNFGQPMSHGCVNMRNEDAGWLFEWTEPAVPANAKSAQSSEVNPGTLVVIQ